jgi:hypothetical protein
MNRQFLKSTMDVDKKTPAYKIICNHCRQSEKVAAPHNILPPEFVAKKFRQKGWIVSKKGNEDICPKCLMPAPTKSLPTAALLAFTPPGEKQKSLPSLKDLATVMTPPTPPVLVTPAPAPNPPEAKPAPKPTVLAKPEFTGPLHAMVGEIRYSDVIKSGWVNLYALTARMKTKELNPRRADQRKTFFKREELVKVFGEPKARAALQLPKPTPKVEAPAPIPIQTEPAPMNHDPRLPPEMTKEDRRIIFAEIDTHYLDETTGYAANYDDKRIADGLKVPLAWVRTIREENFGPEKSANVDNEVNVLKKALEEAQKVLKATEDMIAKNKNIMWSIEDAQRTLQKQVETVNAAIVQVNNKLAHLTGKKW